MHFPGSLVTPNPLTHLEKQEELLSLNPKVTLHAKHEFFEDEEVQEVQAILHSRRVTMNSFATHKELIFVLFVVRLNAIS
jgi:hypothetical protein